jgi:hypothetical protein
MESLNEIEMHALELSLRFSEESDIPNRYKKSKSKMQKTIKPDSIIEKRFQQNMQDWITTITSILENSSDINQAWRFIRIAPMITDPSITSVTKNQDFIDFNSYLHKRRDMAHCHSDELGYLCLLLHAFQKKIENSINQASK